MAEALACSKWKMAMDAEFNASIQKKTWKLVDSPIDRKIIGCKWVFRIKRNPDGPINKYKARLVAKGFHRVTNFDFKETFSLVVKLVTIKTILGLTISKG